MPWFSCPSGAFYGSIAHILGEPDPEIDVLTGDPHEVPQSAVLSRERLEKFGEAEWARKRVAFKDGKHNFFCRKTDRETKYGEDMLRIQQMKVHR